MVGDDGDTLAGVPQALWGRVGSAAHRLLMLDYDGTLAPFRPDRAMAVPLPRSLDALRKIAGGSRTSVAIVSGRPLEEVERLVGPLTAVFVGEHGWDRRSATGGVVRVALDPRVAAALDRGAEAARMAGAGAHLERKRIGVVLHTRQLPPEEARALEDRCAAAWTQVVEGLPLSVDRIDGGVELRARGRDKGTTVRELLDEAPRGTLGVFVGDDLTDEDAFAAVAGKGFGIRVGTGTRASRATGSLPSCEAVASFLEQWLRATGPEGRDRAGT
jgi:trehalose 6-phosphate phosphatase